MSAYAGSGYASGGGIPVSIDGELSTGASFADLARKGRRAPRMPVTIGAGLRERGGSGVAVRIVDLSTEGFRAATHLDLRPGTAVWLRLPGLECCRARVIWSQRPYVGCAFELPLHPAVLDSIAARAKDR